MAELICTSCQNKNRSGVRFCTQCGHRLIEQVSAGPRLVLLHGENKGDIFELTQNRTFIGREVNNHISISDEKMSKKHAAIVSKDDAYWIEDLHSKNGVYVNGQLISQLRKLSDGNLIKLGYTIFRFESKKQS